MVSADFITSAFIAGTLTMVAYCLWVRRDTWWSRWEAGATLAIAMEGLALLLLTPWAGDELGPALHTVTGFWNLQQLVGWLCLLVGVLANVYHMLVRLTDPANVLPIMRKHLLVPLGLGVTVLLVTFAKSERGAVPDMFTTLSGDIWLTVYEATSGAIVLFMSAYVNRLLLALRHDPRAKATLTLYVVAMLFAVAALAVAVISILFGHYAGPAIWACICLSVGVFAYGLTRSWQEKTAWFTANAPVVRP
ncbi:hypothetical protein MU0083_003679 [[Mycobacterium] kokjensenii]|uniref:Uncharacterized protein n=1 Tax=[Mycobacterium] kokjensenii TaxID=3064287 RepID=A0ABN9NF97_9MYCO|nr:hypothetical protein [Mycolicibacter sp. MU0083]CAJ1505385.1 hypothetical protein MU0083_003679 [Mycolicibacter sp. MU0083]